MNNEYLHSAIRQLEYYKLPGEKTFEQFNQRSEMVGTW